MTEAERPDPAAANAATPSPTRTAEAPARAPRAGARHRFIAFVLGADPRTAQQIRFGLSSSGGHLVWALFYWHTAFIGAMNRDAMHLMVAVNSVGIVGFYLCVRLGWTRNLRDSALVLPQMLWASFASVLGFSLAPPLRVALLQVLCLTQMYGFFRLRLTELAVTGGGAVLMLSTALVVGSMGGLPEFVAREEIYPSLLTIFVLLGITGITMDHSARRDRMSAQKLELNAALDTVRDLVIRDTLTGLFNRRHMQDLLQAERARALHTGRQFAVALMDLDHFKRINDLHGHGTGDDVLRRFADLASLSVRQTDTVARWGGEEFLVLMPETVAVQEARAPLDRLRFELEREEAESLLSRIGLTFSAGIALHRTSEPVEQVVARADRALYAAKAAGRDRLWLDTEMQATGLPI